MKQTIKYSYKSFIEHLAKSISHDAGFVPISKTKFWGDVKRSAYNIPQITVPVEFGYNGTLLEVDC